MSSVTPWLALFPGSVPAGIGVVLAVRALPRKRLEYVVPRWRNVWSVPGVQAQLIVSDGQRPLKNPSVAKLKIANTGNRAFPIDDWVRRLEISTKGLDVRTVAIGETRPRHLNPVLDVDVNNKLVAVSPLLMNSGDMFELIFVIDSPERVLVPTVRIQDLSDMKRRRRLPYSPGINPDGSLARQDRRIYVIGSIMCPALICAPVALASTDRTQKALILLGIILIFGLLDPLLIRWAVKRRTTWGDGRDYPL